MKRRAFVSGIAAAPLGVMAGPALATVETPVMHLFSEYSALNAKAAELRALPQDLRATARLPLFDRQWQLTIELMQLPTISAADFAAKLIADTCQASLYSEWATGDIWIEARRLTGWAHG